MLGLCASLDGKFLLLSMADSAHCILVIMNMEQYVWVLLVCYRSIAGSFCHFHLPCVALAWNAELSYIGGCNSLILNFTVCWVVHGRHGQLPWMVTFRKCGDQSLLTTLVTE